MLILKEPCIRPWKNDIVADDDYACVYTETNPNTSLYPKERDDTEPAARASHETEEGVITMEDI